MSHSTGATLLPADVAALHRTCRALPRKPRWMHVFGHMSESALIADAIFAARTLLAQRRHQQIFLTPRLTEYEKRMLTAWGIAGQEKAQA